MCTITIDPGPIVITPGSGNATFVNVSGTIANCTSNDITVTVACPAAPAGSAQATISGGTWTARVPNKCACGSLVTITATCQGAASCTANLWANLVCYCCPTVTSTTISNGTWNSSGQELVTFVTHLTFPAGCTVTVQRFFGDGSAGSPETFTSSPASYQETHPYNPQSTYTSQLIVLSNPACVLTPVQVAVSAAPLCATSQFWASACKTLQILFLFAAGVAGLLSIASTSGACLLINGAIPAIAGGFTLAAFGFLFILSAVCRSCVCAFLWKLIGQGLLIVGMGALMFVLPANCTQPLPFATPNLALGAAVLLIAAGAGAILYVIWYQVFAHRCPLTICDYLGVIRDSLLIAAFVALAVFFILGLGLTVTHLGFALLAILLLLPLVIQLIQYYQNAGKC